MGADLPSLVPVTIGRVSHKVMDKREISDREGGEGLLSAEKKSGGKHRR